MSSHLQLVENTVTYLSEGELRWKLLLDDVVLIAEYTTNEGPYLEDYFLVFVTIEEGKTFFSTGSFYAAGRDTVLSSVQGRFGQQIQLELCNSTDWKSRVAWPLGMAGKQYFTFTKLPPKNILESLRHRVLGPVYEYTVSHEVRDFIDEQRRLRA